MSILKIYMNHNMKTTPLQHSVVIFLIVSLIISIFYAETLKKSNKKHIISGLFILGAIFIYASMIILDMYI